MEGAYSREQALEELKELVGQFAEAVDQLKAGRHVKEAQVEDAYIKPLFRLLNWNTANRGLPHGREEFIVQASIQVGRSMKEPDYLLQTPDEKTGLMKKWLFIEAKHPKYDLTLETRYIRQVYQYAHSTLSSSDDAHNQVRLALLTDFEEFRLFDCWDSTPLERGNAAMLNQYIVPPFDMTWGNYVEDFHLLWDAFERNQVAKGSLSSLAVTLEERISRRVSPDERFLSDLERWREGIAQSMWRIAPSSSDQLLTASTQLMIDRLVFVKMLSDREIEKDYLDELRMRLAKVDAEVGSTSLYDACRDVFRQLDRTYNGAIFARRPELDTVAIENDVMRRILDDLSPENATYTLAAMPVEIVGHAYERFLGRTIRTTEAEVLVEDKPEVRKAKGVYYTPRYVVDYIVEQTVGALLEECRTPEDVAKLKILDPACGSGSFLLGAYDALLKWHVRFFEQDAARLQSNRAKALVSPKYKTLAQVFPFGEDSDRLLVRLTTNLRKQILVNNIYGVDIDPQAVEVAQFSLSMKAVEGSSREELHQDADLFHTTVLPNLSENILCGNSLIGTDYLDGRPGFDMDSLLRVKPFDWNQAFGTDKEPGRFSCAIGNPPWGADIDEYLDYFHSRYPESTREHTDSFKLFIEKASCVVRRGGYFGLIVPSTILRQRRLKDIRDLLLKNELISLVDLGEDVFHGVVAPAAIFVASRAEPQTGHQVFVEDVSKLPNEEKQLSLLRGGIPGSRRLQSDFLEQPDLAFCVQLITCTDRVVPLGNWDELRCKDAGINYQRVGTGMRTKGRSDLSSRLLYEGSREKPLDRMYWKGADIGRYWIAESTERFCRPDYQQFLRANEVVRLNDEVYGKFPKIVFRQTADRIIAAIDYRGIWFGRSLIALLVSPESEYRLEYILGLLNSTYMRWAYDSIAKESGRVFAQVKIGKVNQLPLPRVDFGDPTSRGRHDRLVTLVEKMNALSSQITLASVGADRSVLGRYLDATDREIDRLVYELYALSNAEIAVVESVRR